MKTGRSMGEVVFIDKGEMDQVPTAVREAFSKESGPIPQVALSDANGTKVYGTSNHKALVGGLDKALRDAKRALRDDLKGAPDKPATADAKSPPSSEPPPPGDIKVTEKNGEKDVTGAPLEQWKSSKGSTVVARVTRVSKFKVTLQTDKGKTVTLNQADLAAESYSRLQEIINP
jgi:hypothetical protein